MSSNRAWNLRGNGSRAAAAAAALSSLLLPYAFHRIHVPISLFSGFSQEPLSPSPSSDIYSWRSGGRSPTPSPPLSEGGSGSSIWGQNTTDEGIVIDEFDDIPRKKRVSSHYPCPLFRDFRRASSFDNVSVSQRRLLRARASSASREKNGEKSTENATFAGRTTPVRSDRERTFDHLSRGSRPESAFQAKTKAFPAGRRQKQRPKTSAFRENFLAGRYRSFRVAHFEIFAPRRLTSKESVK